MSWWKNLGSDRLAMSCLVLVVVVFALGILAPVVAPHDPNENNVAHKFAKISASYPLGSDHLGRCILSRLIYGIRTTVFFSLMAMAGTILIGTVVGMLAGFFRGWLDEVLMRLCDIMLSFPSEVMILAIVGMMGPGLTNIVLANIIAKWAWYTRMIRSIVRQYVDKNYISFAKVAGCSTSHIMKRHLLPATMGELIVLATLDMGAIILNISALSFLGLGVQPPTAEWGMMLNEAKNVMTIHPGQMLAPGFAILVIVTAFSFLGDSMRDALDPKHN